MVLFGMPVIGMLLASIVSPAAHFAVSRGSAYRSSEPDSAKLSCPSFSGVRTFQVRPLRIEAFGREPGACSQRDAAKFGPVRDGVLRYYHRQRAQGVPTAAPPMKSISGEVKRVLACWQNPVYPFALSLRSKPLDADARIALQRARNTNKSSDRP